METQGVTYRSLFAVAEFRWLWLAHALSVAGNQLARVALTVLVFDRTASAGLSALTYAVSYVPDLIGGAFLSGLADRYSRRTVMVVTDLLRAGLVAAMSIPGVPLGVQITLLVGVQLVAVPFSAARQAAMPSVLHSDALALGLGVMSMTYQTALVIGFGVGASVVAALGYHDALLINAATFAVSALVIRCGMAPHQPARRATAHRDGRWHTITAGWRIVASDPKLRILLLIACLSGFYVVPEGLAVPMSEEIGAGTTGAGWLLAANPIGTVLGMLALKRIRPERQLALLGPMALATSLMLIPTVWQPHLIVLVLLWAASGAFSAHDMITQATYVKTVPDSHRGQAVGLAIASLRAAQGLGIIAAGLAAQVLPPTWVIGIAAALGVAIAAAAWAAWSRVAAPSANSTQ
ncbi:arabinose ABC transporter permease [Saccharomonospora piscinae]|uniref:Arabinose ABC transporter permease n=1 Tax=Saccharomonospora piscinae TaxID=687388 RepID=A0A1V9AAP9_SACPI|nr:MFS transporter [Saccharomonospora piscinae]OQO94014.1 arabinose ABC transporter permease [Saccharomonospora piscinae]